MILASDNECSKKTAQTAHPRSLIWAVAVRACPKAHILLGAAHIELEIYF